MRLQAEEGIRRIRALIEYKEKTQGRLRTERLRGAVLDLVELLIGYPVIDVPTAASMRAKTFVTANQAVAKLVEKGILRQVNTTKVNRLFACDEVLKIVGGARQPTPSTGGQRPLF